MVESPTSKFLAGDTCIKGVCYYIMVSTMSK
jgi:hypothetical protein